MKRFGSSPQGERSRGGPGAQSGPPDLHQMLPPTTARDSAKGTKLFLEKFWGAGLPESLRNEEGGQDRGIRLSFGLHTV